MALHRNTVRVALFLALAGFVGGCTPGIQLARWKPARYNLGATRKLAVTGVVGHPAAQGVVLDQLQRQILERGYHTLLSTGGAAGTAITVTTGGTQVNVTTGAQGPRASAEVYLSGTVTRYSLSETQKWEEVGSGENKRKVKTLTPWANVRVSFQVARPDGQILMLKEYEGRASGQSREVHARPLDDALDLYDRATRYVVSSFLDDITPRQVVEKIELDKSTPSLKIGLERAKAGDLAGAELAWKEVARQEPGNAGAIYNLGVLLETRGEFDDAAEHYRRAYALSARSLYRDALNALNRRLREHDALQQRI